MKEVGESQADQRYARRLTELERFGDRRSGGPREHAAADYLLDQCRAAGLDADKEPFRGASSFGGRFLVHVLVAAGGAAVAPRWPALCAAIAAVALASLVAEQMTYGLWLSRCVCRSRSWNVVAHVPAARRATRRVVVCAHYDTQRRGWIWAIVRLLLPLQARLPPTLMQPLLALVSLMILQIVAASAAVVIPGVPLLRLVVPLLIGGYGIFLVLLAQWAVGRGVPGAADNASGVAAALEIAEAWRERPPSEAVELVVLLSGCEETGLMGATAWAGAIRRERVAVPTVVVNIDSVGFGPPRFLGAEVPAAGIALRIPTWLTELCQGVSRGLGLRDAGPHALPGPTDALAFLARGVPAVSIVGFADGPRLPHYHTARDTAANVDFAAARAGTAFAAAVVRALASQPVEAWGRNVRAG